MSTIAEEIAVLTKRLVGRLHRRSFRLPCGDILQVEWDTDGHDEEVPVFGIRVKGERWNYLSPEGFRVLLDALRWAEQFAPAAEREHAEMARTAERLRTEEEPAHD